MIFNQRREVGSPSEIEMERDSRPLRESISNWINPGKMANEKDNVKVKDDRIRRVWLPIFNSSRAGWWHLNNSGRRNPRLSQSHISSAFNVTMGKPTLSNGLEKKQSSITKSCIGEVWVFNMWSLKSSEARGWHFQLQFTKTHHLQFTDGWNLEWSHKQPPTSINFNFLQGRKLFW